MELLNSGLSVDSNKFTDSCLEIYQFQMQHNSTFAEWVYRSNGMEVVDFSGIEPCSHSADSIENSESFAKNANLLPKKLQITHESQIPFLPISLFKSRKISCFNEHKLAFTSSSTTGLGVSNHYIHQASDYELAFLKGYDLFLNELNGFNQLNKSNELPWSENSNIPKKEPSQNYDVIAALLPSYLDRSGSGLIYMVDQLIQKRAKEGGFYNMQFEQLLLDLFRWKRENKRVLIWGVTFGLLEFSKFIQSMFAKETTAPEILISELFSQTDILETGGMKGRGPELTRSEVHSQLCQGFQKNAILSEYGMTELTSQAYSRGNGIFQCPPWMKILIQDPSDFRSFLPHNKTGRICVIDLMNYHSCSFIATDDLGKTFPDGTFEIAGRIDHSDVRGCNQLL